MEHFTKTWAEISLDAIAHNYRQICHAVGPQTKILCVVKADAYGHGAVPVARLFQQLGAHYLAVSSLDEALQLRRSRIDLPVLILGWTPPEQAELLRREHITQAVFSLEQAQSLSQNLSDSAKRDPLLIHIKVDTGMSRLGFPAGPDSAALIWQADNLPGLRIEGIFTHFAAADNPQENFTLTQFHRFQDTIQAAEKRGVSFALRHCANSGAIINYPETHLDMVRPGIILYGLPPDSRFDPRLDLRPAMILKTTVSQVRDFPPGTTVSYGRTYSCSSPRRLAVLCAGYADGLMRAFSGKIAFHVRQWTVPQIGKICMDMCMADVSDTDIVPGDTAVIFGETPTAAELADFIGTISYELVCQVSKRVPRKYLQNGKEIGTFSYLYCEQ